LNYAINNKKFKQEEKMEETNTDNTVETEKISKEKSAEISMDTLEKIIRNHVYSSVAIGLVPLPLIDFAGITVIQLNLVKKIARMHNKEFSAGLTTNIISTMIGGALPVAITPALGSLVKIIPVVGYTLGVVTLPVMAGASTYSIGHVFHKHFESGGTLLTFNPQKIKSYYEEMYTKGKGVTSEILEERKAKKEKKKETKEAKKKEKEDLKRKKKEEKKAIKEKKKAEKEAKKENQETT
jgi:uncharacterized protein (DUF697 family)